VWTSPRRGPRPVLFALRGVEHCGDRFLTVRVVVRDVEELPGRSRHVASELVDEEVHVVPF
jgi:hypothetical protein